MPSRRRPKSPSTTTDRPVGGPPPASVDADLARFAAAVKEDEARKRAEVERRAEAIRHAKELEEAKVELDRAIAAVRRAKDTGRGRAEADQAWRQAKARVIELESGAAPSWAPAPVDHTTEPTTGSEQVTADEPLAETDEDAT
jgi:hypothetical protein